MLKPVFRESFFCKNDLLFRIWFFLNRPFLLQWHACSLLRTFDTKSADVARADNKNLVLLVLKVHRAIRTRHPLIRKISDHSGILETVNNIY